MATVLTFTSRALSHEHTTTQKSVDEEGTEVPEGMPPLGFDTVSIFYRQDAFNLKASLDLVTHRTKYYEFVLRAIFTSFGIPRQNRPSCEAPTTSYNYKLCTLATEHDTKKAGSEVVRQVKSPLSSGLIYPGLHALDRQYLGVDCQFGGVVQRQFFTRAELYLPRLGYAKRAHLMNTMVPGMMGGEMSSSDPDSRIHCSDPPEVVKRKIKKAFREKGNVIQNGLLAFAKVVLMPTSELC